MSEWEVRSAYLGSNPLDHTLTRRAKAMHRELFEELKRYVCMESFEEKLRLYVKRCSESDLYMRYRAIDDLLDILEGKKRTRKEIEKAQKESRYPDIVLERLQHYKNTHPEGKKDLSEKDLLDILSDKFTEFPSPKEYLTQALKHLEGSDYVKEESLRLNILKRIIRYGNWWKDAGFGGRQLITKYAKNKAKEDGSASLKTGMTDEEIANRIDDGIFENLKNASKEAKRPSGEYGLLRAVDDLASGRFQFEYRTVENLYLLAMTYGMTYFYGDPEEIYDPDSDVERILFQNYYMNNMMRFQEEDDDTYKIDPTARGINYKNFAEVVYLYYISRKPEEMTPAERIKKSADMLKSLIKRDDKKNAGKSSGFEEKGTVHYQNLVRTETQSIFSLSEDEFRHKIAEEFDCKVPRNQPRLSVSANQNSAERAFKRYYEIYSEIYSEFKLNTKAEGLLFLTATMSDTLKESEENMSSKERAFYRLMENMEHWMTDRFRRKCEDVKQEGVETGGIPVTRTSYLILISNLFNQMHLCEEDTTRHIVRDIRWMSLQLFFEDFEAEINSMLAEAHYPPLDVKNIMDLSIMLSSYTFHRM